MNLEKSIKEPTEPAIKIYLAEIRKSFTSQKMACVGWVPGNYYIADPLTNYILQTL